MYEYPSRPPPERFDNTGHQYASADGMYADPAAGHMRRSFDKPPHPFDRPLPNPQPPHAPSVPPAPPTAMPVTPAPHVQATASAESLYASAESNFSHARHTPSLYPNPVTVPLSEPTPVPHMAYGSQPSASASLHSSAASERTENDMYASCESHPSPYTRPPSTDASYAAERVQQEASPWASYVPTKRLLPPDTIPQARARIASATVKLGSLAVTEARKGLSRVLETGNDNDLEHFAWQLQTADKAACELDYEKKDDIPTFALSYQQFDPPPGSRFKFGDGLQCRQWANFVVCMKEIAFCGIPRVRVWLDQCLWLRDASQGGWAHTGIVPYVLWPVVSLGYKRPGAERTVLTERRMWPFVEEVAGLWSMGVLIVEEMRDMTNEGSLRRSSSFNRRIKLEPEGALGLLLLNVFHGACDALKTGWKKDVEELEEMAVWNVFANTDEIFVGSDWKHRVAAVDSKDYATAIQSIGLPVRDEYLGGVDVYIDASRKVQVDTWSGLAEFLSGHSCGRAPTPNERVLLYIVLSKYSVVADEMELQLLKVGHLAALWLIVCMDGQSSSFSRGKVRWTKVVAGKMGCALGDALEKGNWLVLSKCLEEQIGEKLRVRDVRDMDGAAIEWL